MKMPFNELFRLSSKYAATHFLRQAKRRRMVSIGRNLSPSLLEGGHLTPLELNVQHCINRLELFKLRACLVKGLAISSNGVPYGRLRVRPGHARQQQGKGRGRMHASHCDAIAGTMDNLRALWIKRVQATKSVSPKMSKILLARGVSELELKNLRKHCRSKYYVKQFFAKYFAKESCLDFTKGEDLLSTTTLLDRDVNLILDKSVERRLRQIGSRLIGDVMLKKMSVDDATAIYAASMVEILNRNVKDYQRSAMLSLQQKEKWQTLGEAARGQLLAAEEFADIQ